MSPRELFQQNTERLRIHQDLVDSPAIREGLMVAFNEFCWTLPESDSPEISAKLDAMREGARRYIATFSLLANVQKPRTSSKISKLENQDAYHNRRYAKRTKPDSSTPAISSSTSKGTPISGASASGADS